MKISAVDIFCGAGGLSHGLGRAGINITAGYDLDESCRYAFEYNNKPAKFYAVDVTAVTGEMLESEFSGADCRLLAGCAPCQPFSTYSLGKTKSCDSKWRLLTEFGRLVKEIEPEIVTMENVPKLQQHKVFQEFKNLLLKLDYYTSYQIVDCADYGIPQTRKRLVLLASKFGPIELRSRDPRRDKRRVVRHVIGKRESINAGEVSDRDQLHRASAVSAINLQRLQASQPGGTWRDWDDDLVAKCHREGTGSTFIGVYGRMSWDQPAPTITTQFYGFGNGRFGHPVQNRALSLREGAMLQTFPPTYRFVKPGEPIYFRTIGRLIGNAVPVRLGQVIGESIQDHIEK
ncbi:MAG: DNA cytosine methyltransferase [Candidatus Thiodiazotropha lotti]|nr:DNA cytosine methyltransferase [Candidatus Thiodiazotropha lotti]